jgi:archaellum component FlaC
MTEQEEGPITIDRLAFIVAQGFEEQKEYIDARFNQQDQGIDRKFKEQNEYIDRKFKEQDQGIDNKFNEFKPYMDGRFDQQQQFMDNRFDAIDRRFQSLEATVEKIGQKQDIHQTLLEHHEQRLRMFE